MNARTTASAFHPMRGHVADGTEVLMSDGRRLVVRPYNGISGWKLVDLTGAMVAGPFISAYALTAGVVALDENPTVA